MDILNNNSLSTLLKSQKFDRIVHLAAQVGVRNSIDNPNDYAETNCLGFLNILEACRGSGTKHLIYASSSSVYGDSNSLPLSVEQKTDSPISLYAATKKSNELMAHAYSHLFDIKTIGLRFFTVYGPWGRPDMAVFKFFDKILKGEPIQVFNEGNHTRDMTYIDDTVESLVRLLDVSDEKVRNFEVLNIGNEKSVPLMDLIQTIESTAGKKATLEFLPGAPGDVKDTLSDSSPLYGITNYKPSTLISEGIPKFFDWYRSYYSNV